MNAYFDVQSRQLQVDNLKQQTQIMAEESRLKAAQTISVLLSNNNATFDQGLKSELRNYTVEAAKESLRKLRGEADTSLSENNRRETTNISNLKEAAIRMLQIRAQTRNTDADRRRIEAQIKNINSSTDLQNLDKNLKEMGINPNDPQYQRVLGQILGGKDGISDTIKNGWDKVKKWWNKK